MDSAVGASSVVSVYELANERAREFYVGFTRAPVQDLLDRVAREPPPELRHWRFDARVTGRCVEAALRLHDLPSFLRGYVATLQRTGWRVIVAEL